MTRKWIDEPDSAWEPLGGKLPQFYLGKHPSGTFVAMQVSLMLEALIERAAVWNAETCRIEWDPGNASALCWIEDGNQILVLEEVFIPDHHHPAVFATPLQREYVHFLRRFSWPKREHISSDIKNELVSCPVFIDNEAFRIMLPTGEERRFSTRIHKKKSDREV